MKYKETTNITQLCIRAEYEKEETNKLRFSHNSDTIFGIKLNVLTKSVEFLNRPKIAQILNWPCSVLAAFISHEFWQAEFRSFYISCTLCMFNGVVPIVTTKAHRQMDEYDNDASSWMIGVSESVKRLIEKKTINEHIKTIIGVWSLTKLSQAHQSYFSFGLK